MSSKLGPYPVGHRNSLDLSYARSELGDYEKALFDFDQALTLNPNDLIVFANRTLVISLIEKQKQSDI
jgi:tetratricopeptide (TPR) repeat protein